MVSMHEEDSSFRSSASTKRNWVNQRAFIVELVQCKRSISNADDCDCQPLYGA